MATIATTVEVGVNLGVVCGPCSGAAEVRALESGTRLATLAVRCPVGTARRAGGSGTTSVPVTVWDPPGVVETLDAGDAVVVVGPAPAPLLPTPGRRRLAGRARGGAGRPGPATAGACRRTGVPWPRSRRSRDATPVRVGATGRRWYVLGQYNRAVDSEWPGAAARDACPAECGARQRIATPAQRGEGHGDRRDRPRPVEPEPLDRVVIRFAGDSGDGMQLTGDRFTDASAAVRQRPRDDAELPGRDPCPGRHHRRGVVVPGAHLRPRHRHAGRRAERARRHEPGRAQGEPRRACRRVDDHRQRRRVRDAQPRQGGLRRNPLEDGSLDGVPRHPGPDDDASRSRRPRSSA